MVKELVLPFGTLKLPAFFPDATLGVVRCLDAEDALAAGKALMAAGVKLRPAFAGTGYDETVRFFADFSSRLYFMEAEEE